MLTRHLHSSLLVGTILTDICDLSNSLAYAEMYLAIATLIRRFDLELFETTKKNIEFARDFGTPFPDEGNYNIRVLVRGIVKE